MKVIRSGNKRFPKILAGILTRGEADSAGVEESVRSILADVRSRVDCAVTEYTKRFDRVDLRGRLEVSVREINGALKKIPKKDVKLLELAARRIEAFHRRQ